MSVEAVLEAHGKMIELTRRRHRGPGDTWTAARDRLADDIGLTPANLERLWDKWKGMKDVSGGVLLAILRAYEAECEKHERAADHYRSLREGTQHGREIDQEPVLAGMGMAAMESQSSQAGARPRA